MREHTVAAALATVFGVLTMNTHTFAAGAQQLVLDHLQAAFNTTAESVNVLQLPPRELPEGAAEFYVEPKGSREHGSRNCVVMGGKVYCSGADGEFARLLREQALLDRGGVDASALMRLYALLALPRQVKYVNANVLALDSQTWRAYPEVVAPSISTRPDGGVTLTFYATPVAEVQPSKWTVTVKRNYDVEVASVPLAPR